MGIRNLIYMGGMNMKSKHSLGNLVTAVIAKIINHLEVCAVNRSIGRNYLDSLVAHHCKQCKRFVHIATPIPASIDPNQMRFKNGPPLPLVG